jgi:TRAP-type C4-dicarboxylate transport system permease small subunit
MEAGLKMALEIPIWCVEVALPIGFGVIAIRLFLRHRRAVVGRPAVSGPA